MSNAGDGSGCECALCFRARDADLMVCGKENARFLGGCWDEKVECGWTI